MRSKLPGKVMVTCIHSHCSIARDFTALGSTFLSSQSREPNTPRQECIDQLFQSTFRGDCLFMRWTLERREENQRLPINNSGIYGSNVNGHFKLKSSMKMHYESPERQFHMFNGV